MEYVAYILKTVHVMKASKESIAHVKIPKKLFCSWLLNENFSDQICPNDCNGNGECDFTTGSCRCLPGFGGDECNGE